MALAICSQPGLRMQSQEHPQPSLRPARLLQSLTTLVLLQVGMPSDQAQYIHRIGRTARAGKQGEAILLLHDFEHKFLNSLRDLPVQRTHPAPPQVTLPSSFLVLLVICKILTCSIVQGSIDGVIFSCVHCDYRFHRMQ